MKLAYHTFAPRKGAAIAYRKITGSSTVLPGVIFLGGFRSDMTGTKASFLEEQCKQRNQTFVRFDYTGHGASSGKFEAGNISTWLADAEAVLEQVTSGPQILVGSSMGGWLAMLVALNKPQRIKGLLLIAPAPDFSEDIYRKEFGEEERRHLDKKGVIYRPSSYGDPYPLTLGLFTDARKHLLLTKKHVYDCPMHIIHGRKDADVPWQKAERIMEQSMAPRAKLTFIEDGDHRLARPEDLRVIDDALAEMSQLPKLEAAK